jgi:hypothetical protein
LTGFATFKGADSHRYKRATHKFRAAYRVTEQLVSKYGAGVASGMVVRLGNDTEQIRRFTDVAAAKVGELIADEGNLALKLRAFISDGGCSGYGTCSRTGPVHAKKYPQRTAGIFSKSQTIYTV